MIFFYTHCVLGPGGGQSIIVRMAEELSSRRVHCAVLDVPWGYLWSSLETKQNEYLKLVSIEGRRTLDDIILDDDIVITFQTHVQFYANNFKRSNSKLLIWDISGFDWWGGFLRGRPQWFTENTLMKKWRKHFAHEIATRNGVVFINEVSETSFKKFASLNTTAGRIVPIPLPVGEKPLTRRLQPNKLIHGVYIGRSEAWKIAPARKIAQDFLQSNRMRLTIITDSVERFSENFGTNLKNVDFIEGLSGVELEKFLLNEVDVCFGMGTACLEGARLGLPSILCDFTFDGSDFPLNYRYRWLFEEKSLCLGREVVSMAEFPGATSAEILQQLENANVELGTLCWEMVRDNYNVSIVADKLLNALDESELTLNIFRNNLVFQLVHAKSSFAEFLNRLRSAKKRIQYRPNYRSQTF